MKKAFKLLINTGIKSCVFHANLFKLQKLRLCDKLTVGNFMVKVCLQNGEQFLLYFFIRPILAERTKRP